MIRFGFSYLGLFYLLLLFVPNLLWAKRKPQGYDRSVGEEKKILLVLERTGEVLVCGSVLVFSDFYGNRITPWSLWLLLSLGFMALYELYWVRYFRSRRTMSDFYSSFLGIPVAGATLPVLAFFLLGIYRRNPFLMAASAILGIGHIGIHLGHKKKFS